MKGTTMSLPVTKQGILLWKMWFQEGWKSNMPQNCSQVTSCVACLTARGSSQVPTSPSMGMMWRLPPVTFQKGQVALMYWMTGSSMKAFFMSLLAIGMK
eukprot:CAMPEP_0202920654 /NCGR_PEP_ID=MMETSP1392-20130828/76972_1 /ASSEMBLY_ACC=CAM_ASM_000868 /TAXON_ID=225041 /ORGANISM="Chlamydomonas chlamydogama, Strain SAG 11-48b" /LENGTH=98 /DNA_ID=CAMNT_0049614161 /DNA_START=1684 /DNA_END=1983 /DNA_ORIENTATION=+